MELFKFFQDIDLDLLLRQKEYLVELQGEGRRFYMLEGILTMLDKVQDISETLKKNPAWYEELWLKSDLLDAIDNAAEDNDAVEISEEQIEELRNAVFQEGIFEDKSRRIEALETLAESLKQSKEREPRN